MIAPDPAPAAQDKEKLTSCPTEATLTPNPAVEKVTACVPRSPLNDGLTQLLCTPAVAYRVQPVAEPKKAHSNEMVSVSATMARVMGWEREHVPPEVDTRRLLGEERVEISLCFLR